MFGTNTPSIQKFMRNRLHNSFTKSSIKRPAELALLGIIGLAIGLGSIGCQNAEIKEARSQAQQQPEITAEEILSTVINQYESANTYQDNAVLYLTYRLNGRAIQEPNPWSTAWQRQGQFSCDLFNSKVRFNGESLSCYIFDIETGNIDNQHLIVPNQPFGYLFNDKIASHFISGASELPLDELETTNNNRLVPPTLGFLDESLIANWLKEPQQLSRLADDESLGVNCHVLKLVKDAKEFRVWINQQSGMVEQVEYPLQYLDSIILASDDVTDLRFFARFHDASLNEALPAAKFKIQDRIATKQVRSFVTLPEPIPCLKLGEDVGAIEFVDPLSTKRVAIKEVQSPATAMLWLTGFSANDLITRFGELAKSGADKEYQYRVVYSDDLLEAPGSGAIEPLSSLQKQLDDSNLSALYDAQMKTSSELEMKAVPALIVIDKNNRVQFAKAIDSDDWEQQLKVAMDRVAKGENVAKEMRAEYQRFLDDYHQQLATATSIQAPKQNDRLVGANLPLMSGAAGRQLGRRDLLWVNNELTTPGNVHVPIGSSRMFVLDGWQTVAELDVNGKILKKYGLNIPSTVGINRLRSLKLSSGDWLYVAFSMLGKQAFVFDQNWQKKYELPSAAAKISECELRESKLGKVELWVASLGDQGLRKIDIKTGVSEVILKQPVRGFCQVGGNLLHLNGDRLQNNQINVAALADWKITAVRRVPNRQSCVAIGSNNTGEWKLFCMQANGKIVWSERVSPQYFENEIEPLAFTNMPTGPMAILATGDSSFSLFDVNDGKQKAFQVSSSTVLRLPFSGIGGFTSVSGRTLSSGTNSIAVVVCNKNGVEIFNIQVHGTALIPASTELGR